MFRTLIKSAVALALDSTGSERIVNAISPRQTSSLVLGYHQVVKTCRTDSRHGIRAMQTSCAMLENIWIGSHSDTESCPWTRSETRQERRQSGKPLAAITFDDGYRDVYLNAFPAPHAKAAFRRRYLSSPILLNHGPTSARSALPGAGACIRTMVPARRYPGGAAESTGSRASQPKRVAQRSRCLSHAPCSAGHSESIGHPPVAVFPRSGVPDRTQCSGRISAAQLGDARRNESGRNDHRITHQDPRALLTSESGSRIREEIDGSRQTLEKQLGFL